MVPVFVLALFIRSVYLDPLKAREDHIVFAMYLLSCCVLFCCSSVYHLFYCHSQRMHDLTIMFDFLGIVLVIFSSFVCGIW